MDNKTLKNQWSKWIPFPDPKNHGILVAPWSFGVYQLRDKVTKQFIYCGKGNFVGYRMLSLLPKYYFGKGTRNNTKLREYVMNHLDQIEYRTISCDSEKEAFKVERESKKENEYLFNT
tara:strand:- start:859 stop:1212 length:354 start_codon:yes stop_codon:yes gene_type:complete